MLAEGREVPEGMEKPHERGTVCERGVVALRKAMLLALKVDISLFILGVGTDAQEEGRA